MPCGNYGVLPDAQDRYASRVKPYIIFFEKFGNLFDDSLPKNKTKVTNLKSVTISAINDVLESCGVSVLGDNPENQDLPIEDNGDLPNEGQGMKCCLYKKTSRHER